MRKSMVNKLIEYAKNDKHVILLTGDLGYNCFEPFIEKFPSQFLNCGICEQTMAGIAAGLALSGYKVFVYSIGNFPTLRCLEQLRNDICYNNLNVTIIVNGGGMAYGYLGMSHHATEDLSILRTLPNMKVCAPADPIEVKYVMDYAYNNNGPAYIRLNRGGENVIHNVKLSGNDIFKLVDNESEIALIGTGDITHILFDIKNKLNEEGNDVEIYSCPIIKPFPKLNKLINKKLIITVEENAEIGGFGTAVLEEMNKYEKRPKIIINGLKDFYSETIGKQDYLRDAHQLNINIIINKIKEQFLM